MTYAVIGLGRFGSNVAKDLLKQEANTILVDKNEKMLNEFKNIVHELYIIDATDVDTLKEAGLGNVDVAIVSIGENVESNILTVMALKEAGVKEIIAKAITKVHAKILAKIGVSRIIFPERDSARRLVKNIIENPTCEIVDITNTLKIARFNVSPKLINLEVSDVLLKTKNLINIIGLKYKDQWTTKVEDSMIVKEGKIIIIGEQEGVDEFMRLFIR